MNNQYSGLNPGRPKHEKTSEIIDLRLKGQTYDAISILLNIPKGTITSICKKEGLNDRVYKGHLDFNKIKSTIGQFIKQKRIDSGLTQDLLAKRLNTEQKVISRLENSEYNPSLRHLIGLSNVLKFSLKEIERLGK